MSRLKQLAAAGVIAATLTASDLKAGEVPGLSGASLLNNSAPPAKEMFKLAGLLLTLATAGYYIGREKTPPAS